MPSNKVYANACKTVKVLDCTIRDGGYVTDWHFDIKTVRETYRALSKSGVDYVELGYHGSEKYFSADSYGQFRFTPPEAIQEISRGILGAKIALMVDCGKFDIEVLREYADTPVKLIRLASHKNSITGALRQALEIKKLGFEAAVNFMGISDYTKRERRNLARRLQDINLDFAYIADSYGANFPIRPEC